MKRDEIEFDAEALVQSVESFAAHVQGKKKLTLRKHQVARPKKVPPMGPEAIATLRQSLNVSQAVFADLLNVPKVTAISWEKGRRHPTGAALRLLDLIRKKPQILRET
jgi:putative transcriptional regulator